MILGAFATLLPVGLARRLARAFVGLVAVALLLNGAISMWLSYLEATVSAVGVQREKAVAAAERVAQFIGEIESQIGWTTRAEWARISVDQRRYDFIRLLRQSPAITEALYIDGSGKEQLRLSRLEPDTIASGIDLRSDPRFARAVADRVWYGPVYFRRGSEPYMTVSAAHAGRNPGVTSVGVNLKLVWDVIASIRVGQQGYAYVTDSAGKLIAHPDMSLVLRDTDLSKLPQVASALKAAASGAPHVMQEAVQGPDGQSVLSASAPIPKLGWMVFVELPRREVLAPVLTSLYQTLALLGVGTTLALLLGSWLARRLARPIQRLQASAQRLGEGDLSQRAPVNSSDEIGKLAERFNIMAERIQDARETLEAKVELRTSELTEALVYQTGSSNILKVIASSPTDVTPVLAAIVDSACEVCDADDAAVLLKEGYDLRFAAHHGSVPLGLDTWPINRLWPAGRSVLDRQILHVHDMLGEEGEQYPDGRELQRRMGHRTILCVPLLRDGDSIGTIVLRRMEVSPFTEKQIGLLQTFADQAVIAIGNVLLFEEVQTRTRELSQSLVQLRAAQDRLVQSEKLASLGQLTAGIAHEIKNPLNFINNFSSLSRELIVELREILRDLQCDAATRGEIDELTDLLDANLDKVVVHGKRADSIVRNMLLHSRAGSGEHRIVSVNALVEESMNLAFHGARAEKLGFDVTMEKHLDPQAGNADLYPQEVTRVLLNLISNGFYAATKRRSQSGEVGFEPRLVATTRDLGSHVEIRVRDNGTGISEPVKARIFDPFFTTKPPGEGTGLGLSLSHDIIVKQHGGTLEVATEPGAFTEFTITLPRAGLADEAGQRVQP